MTSSFADGVRPGTTGLGNCSDDTSKALARASASSRSTSSLQVPQSSLLELAPSMTLVNIYYKYCL